MNTYGMNNYPMYNSQFYMQNLQDMKDRIDKQMQQLQIQNQNQAQMQQPQAITQNFQLAPTQSNNTDMDAKYVENGDEVKNTLTLKNTLFVNKDMTMLWFKNTGGDIKKYSMMEIVELDPKDKEIAELKQQIANMQNMIMNQPEIQKENYIKTQNQNINTNNKVEKKNNRKEG